MEREKYDMERGQAIAYVWGRADGSGRPSGDSLAFGDHWVAYLTTHENKSRDSIDTVYEQWRAQQAQPRIRPAEFAAQLAVSLHKSPLTMISHRPEAPVGRRTDTTEAVWASVGIGERNGPAYVLVTMGSGQRFRLLVVEE